MSTVINEYLFTLRGRPVLFKRSEFCGELHATERGMCAFSPTGFHSLAGHALIPIDQPDTRHPTEIVTQNLLESLAAENDRQREAALREARKTVRRCSRNRLPTPTSIIIDADEAVLYGYFATDAQRTELWQAAYLLYHELAESDNYTPNKLAATAHWDEEICHHWMEHVRGRLAQLRRFMSGDFTIVEFSRSIHIGLGVGYFDLPPKPGGEPVIAIPTIATALTLGIEEPESESSTKSQIDYDAEESGTDETDDDGDGTDTIEESELDSIPISETPKIEQLRLF
ncbi:hypothetical protein M2447_002702 [Ereboglobus sp. PH5-10]|uniref:hypothetical protein n=1 Tax=Ereboglobus sp. PH5-10 TaxID=2940629 RepID=UPI0024057811|nr:hypothetical protein [Ereboglobus sp. PH5-10]MDF9828578.1 hypothetical protein [Ereboglobus sp. PH5-10]